MEALPSRLWALVTGVAVGLIALALLWPSQCVARADGRLDPVNFRKDCATPLGFHVSWGYDSPNKDTFTFRRGPTSPNWTPLLWLSAAAGLAGAAVGFLAAEWRKDRWERLFTPSTSA